MSRKQLEPPSHVSYLCTKLEEAGFQAYIVGGAVRDLLRGVEPTDWDICTDAHPEEVASVFETTLPTGVKYGTVTVLIDGRPLEVTTMRQDGTYTDGRHPVAVTFGTDLIEDLARRDFTINAIAYSPIDDRYIDPFGGKRDIKKGIVRTVGDPKQRFQEDGLRILRFFRFVATLDFKPHRATSLAIDPNWLLPISKERIRDEFSRLITAQEPTYTLRLMHRRGVLGVVIPELILCDDIPKGGFEKQSVLEHSMAVTGFVEPNLVLRLAALLHDVGKGKTLTWDRHGAHYYGHDRVGEVMVQDILGRLRYSKKVINQVSHLVRWHMFQIAPAATKRALRRFIARVGKDTVDDLLKLRCADILGSQPRDMVQARSYLESLTQQMREILQEDEVFSLQDLAVDGRDLQTYLELRPGPIIGSTLSYLLEQVIDEPDLNQRDILLQLAADHLNTNKTN
ncbi:MAG: CCA tRNA nucleotidyltransferase [Limnochordia bacterium]|jgi:tRNA nucleotidyltransferase (CCA-adding enzyme)|nr:CCA tRNA nucleotidyltransferase [Limnochordia bacterium]MDD2628594.1 CCA tRNA nucleotidyltransferase [Limnochordia bacterium]MDD4517346.1 CCA tRNA nucleotidyltransferase [Limnochordia bacterium]